MIKNTSITTVIPLIRVETLSFGFDHSNAESRTKQSSKIDVLDEIQLQRMITSMYAFSLRKFISVHIKK